VGTVVVDDLAAAQAAVDASEVSARWEAEMAAFFATGDGHGKSTLDLVFDLDAQLRAAESPGPAQPTTAPNGDPS
jgi:L-rhamnose mutarotase